MSRARNYCFTLNNYTPEEEAAVSAWECKYLVFGKEVGESGTPHLQGYVCFENQKTVSAMKKYSKRAHWETARGTPQQAIEYCKKDGVVFESGVPPLAPQEKGAKEKKRWEDAFLAVQEGRIEDLDPEMKCRSLKGIEYAVVRQALSKRKLDTLDGEFEHEWLYGKSGCGKSVRARAENPVHFTKDPTNAWWDNYMGQEVVLLEDWDPYQVKQSGDLKRWSDRYPFQAAIKGGYLEIRPRKIVVTSQYLPHECWKDEKTLDAIHRRFKIVYVEPIVIADDQSSP